MSVLWSWPLAAQDGMGLPADRVDCWAILLAIRHPNVRIDCRQAAWPRLFGGSHPDAVNSATAASTAVGS